MGSNPNITIDVSDAEALLTKLPAKLLGEVNQAIHNSGFALQTEIKFSIAGQRDELRSVDTGRFLNSVEVENRHLESEVKSDLPYAQYLEEGTTKITARNHFKNSADRLAPKIKENCEIAIQKAIR